MSKRKVLLIGWDAADWKIINKLMDQGLMPAMESLVNNGVMGNLATLDPPFSPMLWTSIATGKRPNKHGILGFVEPTPDRIAVRPVSSTSRKVKAIWNILSQKGYNTNVVGWWPSHPAEPINGIMISNHYQKMNEKELSPLMPGSVHPKTLSKLFSHLRVHTSEITQQHILPFVPKAAQIDQKKDTRLYHIAKNIAEASSIHAAATWIAENQDWDFLGVYLDSIDHFCHGFMNFHPPKMDKVSQNDFDLYKDVINSAYRFHDMMLETLVKQAGEDATIILVSDHGFHSDHLRPKLLPDEPAGPAYEHREYGIICIKGPGIKKDERIYGASLLDITPTLLQICGLPLGEDMDGVPLMQSFDEPKKVEYIPSWEDFNEGNPGMLPDEMQENPFEATESLQQLVELGYIEEPDEDMKVNVDRAIKEADYNLARVYLGARNFKEALPILKKLFEKEKDQPRFGFRLYRAYKALGEISNCEDVLIDLKKALLNSKLSKQKYANLKEEVENLKKDSEKNSDELKEKQSLLLKNPRIERDLIQLTLFEAELLILKGNVKEGIQTYNSVAKISYPNYKIQLQIASAYSKLGNWEKAIETFEKALEIDPDNNHAYHGIGVANLRLGKYEEAIDALLESIGILYNNPFAHYHLGEALCELNDYENASKALEVSLKMAPNIGKTRNLLIDIYENHLSNLERAKELKTHFQQSKFKEKHTPNSQNKVIDYKRESKTLENPIYIVSGLPRSGTSMMMQILSTTDLELYTDNKREADDSNPKGYYEHEAVKSLVSDNKWLKEAQGKIVKIISQLLFFLPDKYNYKIIFMLRDIDEVIKSQQEMLKREGKRVDDSYPISLKMTFQKNIQKVIAWSKKKNNVDLIFIDYKKTVETPSQELKKVVDFINCGANINTMIKKIEKKLYRIKK